MTSNPLKEIDLLLAYLVLTQQDYQFARQIIVCEVLLSQVITGHREAL
jgi:hypothetical protein